MGSLFWASGAKWLGSSGDFQNAGRRGHGVLAAGSGLGDAQPRDSGLRLKHHTMQDIGRRPRQQLEINAPTLYKKLASEKLIKPSRLHPATSLHRCGESMLEQEFGHLSVPGPFVAMYCHLRVGAYTLLLADLFSR